MRRRYITLCRATGEGEPGQAHPPCGFRYESLCAAFASACAWGTVIIPVVFLFFR